MQTVAVVLGGAGGARYWRGRLEVHRLRVAEVASVDEVGRVIRAGQEVLLIDSNGIDAIEVARSIKAQLPALPTIVVVSESSEERAVAAFRAGAVDYFRYPCHEAEVVSSIRRCGACRARPGSSQATSEAARTASVIVGESSAIQQVRDYIPRVAHSDVTVLITGETGVGKELVAELIHNGSARRARPWVAINCAAIPETLLESELFGSEPGAYTGAGTTLRDGALKSADGGSVFFDEIGDMGLSGQAKILRVIETREVHRLGGRSRIPLNIRIIAATNQELETLAAQGQFRKDLYYRLNVARIHLRPLRERKEDLGALVNHYIAHFNRRFNRDVEGFTAEAMDHLYRHDWPGNVRELRNLVEAVFVNLDGRHIAYFDLPEPFRQSLERSKTLPVGERERLLSALFATNWNKSKAAHDLRWSRMTLYRKIAKYQVDPHTASRKNK